jgi:dihydropteroate synthase
LNTLALVKQAKILRVHDVKAAVEAIQLVEMMNSITP